MVLSQTWLEECLVDNDMDFLNCGTLAPTLKSAFQLMQEARLKWIQRGPGASLELREARGYLNMMEEQDKCRHQVAKWLRVDASSVALLGNVTDGINAALQTIEWSAKDHIVTTDEEHDALQRPLSHLERRIGVRVDAVSFPKSSEDNTFISRLMSKITPQTKLIALSQVSHVTGIPIDITRLMEALEEVPHVYVLIDGAHAAGTTTNLIHPRMDFFTFPGHKWLFGPVETGVLWVSQRILRDTSTMLSGAPMMSKDGTRFEDEEGAWRYEYGTRDWAKMVGLSASVAFRRRWSEETIVDHYATLGSAFAGAFHASSKVKLVGRAPLLSFPTDSSNQIANNLWQGYRILVKPQARNIRISLPPWLTIERASRLGEQIGYMVQ